MSTFAEDPTENDMVVYVCLERGWNMEMEGRRIERTSCKNLTPQKSSMNSDVQIRNMARMHLLRQLRAQSELHWKERRLAAAPLSHSMALLVFAKAA